MTQVIVTTIGHGGGGHDYTTISSWDAATQAPPGVINVGVVFPSIDLRGIRPTASEALDSLIRCSSQQTSDFILIHASGDIIAWKHGGMIHRPRAEIESIFLKDRDLALCIFLIKAFLQKYSETLRPDSIPDIISRELQELASIFEPLQGITRTARVKGIIKEHSRLLPTMKAYISDARLVELISLFVSIAVALNSCFGDNITRVEFGDDAKEFLESLITPENNQDSSKRHRKGKQWKRPAERDVEEI